MQERKINTFKLQLSEYNANIVNGDKIKVQIKTDKIQLIQIYVIM